MTRVRVRDGGPRPSAGPTEPGRSRLVEPWTDRPCLAAPGIPTGGAPRAGAAGAPGPPGTRTRAPVALCAVPVDAPAAAAAGTPARAARARRLRAAVAAPER